jgi:PAS domain S-box-containing protein
LPEAILIAHRDNIPRAEAKHRSERVAVVRGEGEDRSMLTEPTEKVADIEKIWHKTAGDPLMSAFGSGTCCLVFTADPSGEDYLLTELDHSAAQLLGAGRQELLGKPLRSLPVPVFLPDLAQTLTQVRDTGQSRQTTPAGPPEANSSLPALTATIYRVSAYSLAVVLAPTENRQMAQHPADRGGREWEKTFDAIDDLITIQDTQMNIIRANRAAHRIFGHDLGDLVGRKCHEIFQGSMAPCKGCPVVESSRQGSAQRDYVVNRHLGKTFDVSASPVYDDQGRLTMVVHVARDVTTAMQREAESRRLSTAIEHASEVMVITDPNGVIEYVNPAFTVSTGYTRAELLGKNMNILNSGRQDQDFYRQMWQTILAGRTWSGHLINRKKDGTLYPEVCTISPVFEGPKIASFVAVKRDVSKEESLERQLQQAIKLEAIGTLAGGIAHDFNNILSAILGFAYIAKNQLPQGDPTLHALDRIVGAGERAADLVKQILTFSRHDTSADPFKPLKIQYILKEVLQLLRSSLPSTIKLSQQLENDTGVIMADAGQIHQVIMNLCTNARQAIGDGYGEIAIRLRPVVLAPGMPEDRMPELPYGDYLELAVSDTGCGMDEAIKKRIFDPFFTTKPKDHGTGLGLSVVHGIVKKHRGAILVETTPGEGTTFRLFFPAVQSQSPPVESDKSGDTVPGGRERIVLVDDEALITELLYVSLERLGYRVTSFTDSLEAASFFRQNKAEVDLVISDVTMPNMTGTELAREILALHPQMPIILITGYHESIDREKVLRLGVREFLHKPMKKKELAQVIRRVLDHG